jgi:hypothetical protein
MRRCISATLSLVAGAALVIPVAAQISRSRTTGTAGTSETHVTAAKAPYTAEYKITSVQTLADGNVITREDSEVTALDPQGRQMHQMTTTRAKDQAPVVNVNVFDPVAKTDTHWSSLGKQATVYALSGGAGHGCAVEARSPRPATPHTKPVIENLGTASIQGVEARGTRTTNAIPAGEVGNEASLVTTTERWTAVAVGLKGLVVREITDDPRWGKWTKELTSISQEDPDPALFQPPAGYEIVTKDSGHDCPPETTPKDKE